MNHKKLIKRLSESAKASQTAIEVMFVEKARRKAFLNYRMAKALVEGRVTSEVLRYAEQEYETQRDIFEYDPQQK